MALTYQQSSDLMNDFQFRGRIKVAVLHYATYIAGEEPGTTAHNSRYRWAQSAFQSPDTTAAALHPVVVMDANVQESGADIDDVALQTAVEGVVNKVI